MNQHEAAKKFILGKRVYAISFDDGSRIHLGSPGGNANITYAAERCKGPEAVERTSTLPWQRYTVVETTRPSLQNISTTTLRYDEE